MKKEEREMELFNLRRTKRGLVEIEKLYEEYVGVPVVDRSVTTYQKMCDVIIAEEASNGEFD